MTNLEAIGELNRLARGERDLAKGFLEMGFTRLASVHHQSAQSLEEHIEEVLAHHSPDHPWTPQHCLR